MANANKIVGPHRNDEIAGDRVTWGTATEIRAYERGEV